MSVSSWGAIAAGFVASLFGLALYAHIVRGLLDGRLDTGAVALALAILFGTSIASAPVGKAVFDNGDLWAWFMLGELILLVPGGIIVVTWLIYRHVLRR